jgi:hypothetical protein
LYGQTLPNLINRFVMGVGAGSIGQSGGTNTLNLEHSHTVNDHSHGLPAHSHWVPDHAHAIPDHSHSLPDHAHGIPNHAHDYNGTTSAGCCAFDGGYYYSGDDSTRYAAKVYASTGAWYYRHAHTFGGTTSGWSGATSGWSGSSGAWSGGTGGWSGNTGEWSGNSGGSQPGTNSQLANGVDNRPEYIGLLYLVRIK